MPVWDTPYQCIKLSRRDESRLKQKTEEFVNSLLVKAEFL